MCAVTFLVGTLSSIEYLCTVAKWLYISFKKGPYGDKYSVLLTALDFFYKLISFKSLYTVF